MNEISDELNVSEMSGGMLLMMKRTNIDYVDFEHYIIYIITCIIYTD